jgi:hypothetical protein
MQKQIGGSFAPPVDDQKLSHYEALMAAVEDRQVREYGESLVKMLRTFQAAPSSKAKSKPHPSGRGTITPLEQAEIERIWDCVPWPEECDAIDVVFDRLPSGDVRNAAYHLLWFARELSIDREPCTTDKL